MLIRTTSEYNEPHLLQLLQASVGSCSCATCHGIVYYSECSLGLYRAFSTRDPGYAIIPFAYPFTILVHHAAVMSVSVVMPRKEQRLAINGVDPFGKVTEGEQFQ